MGLLSTVLDYLRPQSQMAPALPPAPTSVTDAKKAALGDGLQNLAASIGTNRDKAFAATYSLPIVLTRFDLDNMYRGSWLASKIVSIPADDMTREWVTLSWDGKDDDQDAGLEIDGAAMAFKLRSKVNEAITWGRLYGGCVIVIGIKGEDFAAPLVLDTVKQGSLASLNVLDRWRIAPTGELDLDMASPNFGLPLQYQIADSSVIVHWSRLVRFNGHRLPYQLWQQNGMWDDSELQHVVDSTKHYDGTSAALGSLLYEAKLDIIRTAGLADLLSTAEGEALVAKRYQTAAALKSINGLLLLDKDTEDYEQKTIAFSGMTDLMNKFMIDVCGAADIPTTRLFGQSPAGLTATGESDLRNYYDHIASEQETDMRPQLELLYQVLIRSVLGAMPDHFAFDFNPLWQETAAEKAAREKSKADTDVLYITNGVITRGLAARELKELGTYPTMNQDDVSTAEEEDMEEEDLEAAPPPPGVPPAGPGGAPPGPGEPPTPFATGPDKPKPRASFDAMPGDMIRRDEDGWNVFADGGGKHVGGPYKTRGKAMRRLRQIERFDRR